MQMYYESAFGIYDHSAQDSPETPWPLLVPTQKESLTLLDPLDFRLDQFAENRVFEVTGIPFHELIQFPRRDYLKAIAAAKKHSEKALGVGDRSLKKLEQMLSQAGKTPPAKPQG